MKKVLFYFVLLATLCYFNSCEKPSSDATLKSILIDGKELEGFDGAIINYEVKVPKGTTISPQIEAIPNDPAARVEIQKPSPFPGIATIYVTAKDGTSKKYTIRFFYDVSYSSDATIQSILIDDVPLDGVDANILAYEFEVPIHYTKNYPKIDVITTSPAATVDIERELPNTSSYFPCKIIINVTAEDKVTKKTYTIDITQSNRIELNPTGSMDGYDYVDLGLSVKWATHNVGAKSIVEYGDYFAWGETEKYNTLLTAKNYEYALNRCSPDKILSSIYDAVSKNWSKNWRMPTLDEMNELIDNCLWFWTDNVNNINISGYYAVSKINGNAIFWPMGSYIPHEDYLNPTAYRVYYWSSWAGLGDQEKINISAACVRFIMSNLEGGSPASEYFMNRADGLYVRGVVGAANEYIPDEEFTLDEDETERQGVSVSGTMAGHTYVDLGLPSRTLWATYNLGASMPTEYGGHYAWGETETKSWYFDDTYKFYDDSHKITKYCFYKSKGNPDGKSELDPEDDVAMVRWGSNWSMPTKEQFKELASYCTFVRKDIYVNGKQIIGYLGTSEINGHTIYIPCAGWEYRDVPNNHMFAWYWSRNLAESSDDYAYYMTIVEETKKMDVMEAMRLQGLSIRPVTKK